MTWVLILLELLELSLRTPRSLESLVNLRNTYREIHQKRDAQNFHLYFVGLDPSKNFFDHDFRSIRLDYSQADYVDTVNTDSGFRGLGRNIGHINIFPNGGSNQIGCGESHWPENWSRGAKYVKSVICDHSRAFLLMMEDWANNTIDCEPIAYACDSYGKYERGSCTECGEKNQNCELLGLEKLPGRELPSIPDEDTSYYIRTSDKSPFCGE